MMRTFTVTASVGVAVLLWVSPAVLAKKTKPGTQKPQLELVEFVRGRTETIMPHEWVATNNGEPYPKIEALNDEDRHEAFVRITTERDEAPTDVYLPTRNPKSSTEANGIRMFDNGAVLVTGVEIRRSGTKLPSIWILRSGREAHEWEHWVLDARLFRKGTRPPITHIAAVFGFERDSDRVVCAAVAGGTDLGTAYIKVYVPD